MAITDITKDIRSVKVCAVLTEREDTRGTEVLPAALAVKSPGMLMGSGDRSRPFITAGSSPFPQFSQLKPET